MTGGFYMYAFLIIIMLLTTLVIRLSEISTRIHTLEDVTEQCVNSISWS